MYFSIWKSSLQVRGRRPSQLPLDRAQSCQEPLHQPGSVRKSHRRKGEHTSTSSYFSFLFTQVSLPVFCQRGILFFISSYMNYALSSLFFHVLVSSFHPIRLHPTSSRSMQRPLPSHSFSSFIFFSPLHIHWHHFIIVFPFFLNIK